MKPICLVAGCCLLLALLTIDAAGNFPRLPEGPGLTIDESFNVEVGTFLVRAEAQYGLAALSPASQTEIFGQSLNDHPPLGRVALGLSNVLVTAVLRPDGGDATLGTAAAARPAAAVAFALTVLLTGWCVRRWSGDAAGFWAALALATTPRAFGHAHIASLETFVGLTYAVATFAVADLWANRPTGKSAAVCGVLWGLCLLTKIQAVLWPVPVGVWALACFRKDAVGPLAITAASGLAVFFVGWPYLWIDPIEHVAEYFGRAGDRITLHVFFAGERYADRGVPVLYAPVMFVLTQPLVWLIGGMLGAVAAVRGPVAETRSRDEDAAVSRRRWRLLLAAAVFPVLFFAAPNFATYDGVRLFLVAYPIWACVCGVGMAQLTERLRVRVRNFDRFRPREVAAGVAFGLLIVQSPVWLSHYNLLIGGTRGAAALGMEPTYWGDSLTRSVWDTIPQDSRVAIAPTLHQFQVPYLASQTPAIARRRLTLEAWTPETTADVVLVFRRRADLPPSLAGAFERDPGAVRTWDGVPLTAVIPADDP